MVKLNKIIRAFTLEGARAKRFTPGKELKRTLMRCLLWEDQFYEDGVAIAERIETRAAGRAGPVAALAIEAREELKLRHAPLMVVREMARHEKHRVLVAETLARVIQRPDELTELLRSTGPMRRTDAAAQASARHRADQKGSGRGSPSSTPISWRIRPRRRVDPRPAVPGPRQAEGRGPGQDLEAARRRRARLSRIPGKFRSRPARTSARPSSG